MNTKKNIHSMAIFLAAVLGLVAGPQSELLAADKKEFVCPPYKIPKKIKRSEVYSGMPFRQGESSRYELRYFGALAGYGAVTVKKPTKFRGLWHRVFQADASTGDWYKLIFVAHDTISAVTQPWDQGIAKFYMKQDEGKFFSKRFFRKKWLEFDHKNCKVTERIADKGKDEKNSEFDLAPGSMDTLGALFQIRTMDFKVGEKKKAPVYSSEKNWFIELEALAFEQIKTDAGTFDTVKLKVQTYIGEELEQKGDVYMWIDRKTPDRPLVRVEGKVKIGTVKLELVEFKPGRR